MMANEPDATAEGQRRALLSLNQRMLAAEQAGDADFLATVISDSLLFRRADKTVVDKKSFLQGVPAAATRLTDREAFDIEITVLGPAALVTLMVIAKAEVDGQRRPRIFKNIRFFAQHDGVWQLEHWYNE